jgi:hypothetical protein
MFEIEKQEQAISVARFVGNACEEIKCIRISRDEYERHFKGTNIPVKVFTHEDKKGNLTQFLYIEVKLCDLLEIAAR